MTISQGVIVKSVDQERRQLASRIAEFVKKRESSKYQFILDTSI